MCPSSTEEPRSRQHFSWLFTNFVNLSKEMCNLGTIVLFTNLTNNRLFSTLYWNLLKEKMPCFHHYTSQLAGSFVCHECETNGKQCDMLSTISEENYFYTHRKNSVLPLQKNHIVAYQRYFLVWILKIYITIPELYFGPILAYFNW